MSISSRDTDLSAEEFVLYKELCLWSFLLQRKANARQQSLSDKIESLI